MQDVAIKKFCKFATARNVHVNIVVHPRKEDEGSKLAMSSIYGSAKATQEANLVLILQNDKGKKSLEVKKNRFDGTLGHCPLHFQRDNGRYTESPMGGGVGGDGGARPPPPPPPPKKKRQMSRAEAELLPGPRIPRPDAARGGGSVDDGDPGGTFSDETTTKNPA